MAICSGLSEKPVDFMESHLPNFQDKNIRKIQKLWTDFYHILKDVKDDEKVNSYEVIKDRTKMWLRLFLEVKFGVILFMSTYFSSIIIFFPRYILRNLSHHTFTFFPITFGGSIKTQMDLITSIWKERRNSTMLLKIHIRGLQTKKMSSYLFSKS